MTSILHGRANSTLSAAIETISQAIRIGGITAILIAVPVLIISFKIVK